MPSQTYKQIVGRAAKVGECSPYHVSSSYQGLREVKGARKRNEPPFACKGCILVAAASLVIQYYVD